MSTTSTLRKPILVAVVIVIVVAASVGVYFATQNKPPATTTATQAATTTTATTVAPLSGGTIVVEEPCCIDSLDPAIAFTNQGGEAVQNIYQGLVTYKPNTTEIVPLLAQSYNVSSDGLTYTFQLRQNITFSNGDPFNAYVMWYSIYRAAIMAQPASYLVTVALNTTSVTAQMLNMLNTTNNIPPPSLMPVVTNSSNAITVTGPYTMQFHLMAPFAAFLGTLTQPQDFAVDPLVVSQHGGVVAGNPNTWMTVNALSTGPFMVTQYQPNTILVLARNPTYWGGANGAQPTPRLDKVIVKSVPDALTRLEDLQSNSSQLILLDLTLGQQIQGKPGIYVPNLGPLPSVHLIGLNNARFPFSNVQIRQAVVHAINYTALVQLFHGYGAEVVGPEPRGILGYASDLQPYSYNVTLSKQLLAQAGYPDGKGIPTVTAFAISDIPPSTDVVSLIQADLAQIGINVQIKTVNSATALQAEASPATSSAYPDMTYDGYNWFPDPWPYANWWVGDLAYGAGNFAWYNNTQVVSLLHQADRTLDPTQRAALYEQVAHIVYNDAPYIWVAQLQNAYPSGIPVVSDSVQGYSLNIGFWQSDFSTLYLASG